jgi:hypothetical protein
LVYVGLSRVTSIDGLYLTNANNDFNFYHGRGSNAPGLKEMTEEYLRLETSPVHGNKTLRNSVDSINTTTLLTTTTKESFIVCTLNIQSLVAHNLDLSSDPVTSRSDYLALMETWMDKVKTVDILQRH